MVRNFTARALAQRLATEQSDRRLPSIAAGLVRDGKLTWFGGVGDANGAPPTDETQYRCGSISKTFVAVGVMRLRDQGTLDLSDPISRHLPEVTTPDATIAQLLSHTSGLRSETSGPWWERTPGQRFAELLESSARPADCLVRPGRRFHYSNVGYAILGELIGRIRGTRWDDVVDDELLRPLGMLRTTTRPVAPYAQGLGVHPHADVVLAEPEHDGGAMAPAGQLWTTVDDLSRWATVLMGLRPEILATATAKEMSEPAAIFDIPDTPWTVGYGLGLQLWNIEGRRRYGHMGSMPGHLAFLVVDGATSDTAVGLTNATSGLSQEIVADLLKILQDREPIEPKVWRPAAGGIAAEVLEITGAWYWGTSGFVLSLTGEGKLDLHALRFGREATFAPLLDDDGEPVADTYIGLSGYYHGETMRVVRRPDGSASHLDIGSFVLARSPYDPGAEIPGGVDEAGWQGGPPEESSGPWHPRLPHLHRGS